MGPFFFVAMKVRIMPHSPLTLIATAVIGFFLAYLYWIFTQAIERAWTEADDLERQFGTDIIGAFKYKFLGGKRHRG